MKLENFSRIHLRCGRTCLDRCFGNKLGSSRLTVLVVNGSSHNLHDTCSISMSTLIQSLLASLLHTVIFHRLSLRTDHSVSATVAAEHAPSHSMIILCPLLPETKAIGHLPGVDMLIFSSRALVGPQKDMKQTPFHSRKNPRFYHANDAMPSTSISDATRILLCSGCPSEPHHQPLTLGNDSDRFHPYRYDCLLQETPDTDTSTPHLDRLCDNSKTQVQDSVCYTTDVTTQPPCVLNSVTSALFSQRCACSTHQNAP